MNIFNWLYTMCSNCKFTKRLGTSLHGTSVWRTWTHVIYRSTYILMISYLELKKIPRRELLYTYTLCNHSRLKFSLFLFLWRLNQPQQSPQNNPKLKFCLSHRDRLSGINLIAINGFQVPTFFGKYFIHFSGLQHATHNDEDNTHYERGGIIKEAAASC